MLEKKSGKKRDSGNIPIISEIVKFKLYAIK